MKKKIIKENCKKWQEDILSFTRFPACLPDCLHEFHIHIFILSLVCKAQVLFKKKTLLLHIYAKIMNIFFLNPLKCKFV